MKWWMLLTVLLLVTAGCQRRVEMQATTPFVRDYGTFKLAILMDLSGSFAELMAEDGKGYDFAMQVIEKYAQGRVGASDTIVIGQISGTEKALLWEGTPIQLRQDFANASEFRKFLLSKSSPNGSLVHASIASAVEYVANDPAVASGRVRPAVFVLSDMLDNGPEMKETKQRLVDAFKLLAKRDGLVGIYYVEPQLLTSWRESLADAGISDFVVEADIIGRPMLPDFDQ